jgi:hypothetical protein
VLQEKEQSNYVKPEFPLSLAWRNEPS